MKFYAAWDNISTTTPWGRPELFSLLKTWNELKDKHNFNNYDVYVAGGFAEYLHNPTNPKTWDIDLCYVFDSDELNDSEIKSMLDVTQSIGFKNEVFIDVKFVPRKTWDFFIKLHNGKIPPKSEMDDTYYITNWKKFIKIIDGVTERETQHEPSDYTEIYDGLYRWDNVGGKFVEKVTEKFNSGLYKGKNINLKTSDFVFTQ